MNRKLTIVLPALMAALTVAGCEEKKPATTPPAPVTGTAPDAGKPMTDAAKDAMDKAKTAVKDTADKAQEKVKEGVAAMTEKAQAAMKEYLGGLGDANSAMEKIKSALDAPAGLAALNDAAKKVNTNSAVLGSLPAGEQTALKDANKDQLSALTAKFKAEVSRLTSDSGLGKIVGDALKSFKLFE